MKDLAEHTIPGVEHDSSERDPPPLCHPGTRLDICGQAQSWFHNSNQNEKILWIHGPAGVGKSAIMQTLAQEEHKSPTSILGATVFFSKLRQRNDPNRLFNTIAYQLAVRYKPYCQYITNILSKDPKIVEKSMKEQFHWLIEKPFVEKNVLQGHRSRVLIILDGLDEVEGIDAQRLLVALIGRFAADHTSPLIWAFASRSEPDIIHAFRSLPQMPSSCREIQVHIDSDQGRADMELFLRKRFNEIRERYGAPLEWPSEVDFLRIAKAASGLFIFGETAIRFIDDDNYGNPISQLGIVIAAIEATPLTALRANPLASIDKLYERILSTIPSDVRPITMRLLGLSFAYKTLRFHQFWLICNWLELSQADAYGALRKLHSVVRIPSQHIKYHTELEPHHKSFSDYILSPTRSGKFHAPDPLKIMLAAAVRVLRESHNPFDCTIEVSRVKVSASENNFNVQTSLYQLSLFAVVDHINDAVNCEGDAARTSERLTAFFRDVNFADFSGLGIDSYTVGYWFRHKNAEAGILSVLKDWGIAQPITIPAIQMDRVRADEAADVLGQPSILQPTAIPHFFTVSTWFFGYLQKAGDELIVATCQEPDEITWGKLPFSHFPDWRERLQEHLQAIGRLKLPARAYLIGKGRKSVVGIYQNINAEHEWCYIIPYDRS
ncbi:hypothetical protein AN958_11717 [Leucoagaricus sp. SymC.cos]|nr:hypothetical protein AN958_11717 [Leucoagaricus sp. SymC.cos]